ncbi:MAG: ribosome silencing factor [Acidobacteria bacterium]|jgi:ribosome-associated protein|nr:ribosome silencing factor [Acidobacteriota bacterium]
MKKDEFTRVLDELRRRRMPGGVKKAVEALLDKKAEKVTVLNLKGLSEMTDYLIVCSGASARQNRALADAVRDNLKRDLHLQPLGSEGEGAAEWILVDYVDFVVNVFSAEWRKKYSLEKLWMDAKRYDFSPAG